MCSTTALGRLAKASEGPTGVFEIEGMVDECGGPAVQPCTLSPTLFDASEMLANQVKMTITQLRDELRERGAPTSGQLKVILQRRLRALIIASTAAERRVRQSDDARCRLTRVRRGHTVALCAVTAYERSEGASESVSIFDGLTGCSGPGLGPEFD